jgi:hypothetical protein
MNEGPTARPTGNLLYTVVGKTQARFADYVPLPVSVTPSLKDYSISDFSLISNVERMGVSDDGKKALVKNFFYLTPSSDDQIYDAYQHLSKAGLPAFVTTDSVSIKMYRV